MTPDQIKAAAAALVQAEDTRTQIGLLSLAHPGMTLDEAVSAAVAALGAGSDSVPGPDQLEAAVLERSRPRRTFRRLTPDRLATMLGVPAGGPPMPGVSESPDLPPAGAEGP